MIEAGQREAGESTTLRDSGMMEGWKDGIME
jgi:hypothetical protein